MNDTAGIVERLSAFAALHRDISREHAGEKRAMHLSFASLADDAKSEIERLSAELERQWQPIETAPKNLKVLAAYQNGRGNWRIVTACYHTQLPWSDDHWRDYDDENEYAPEGWYEESDSSETIYPTDEPPTHWMPLPPRPGDRTNERSERDGGLNQSSIPDGWVLVPREPTTDMAEDARDWSQCDWKSFGDPKGFLKFYQGIYRAMINAAPKHATAPTRASTDKEGAQA